MRSCRTQGSCRAGSTIRLLDVRAAPSSNSRIASTPPPRPPKNEACFRGGEIMGLVGWIVIGVIVVMLIWGVAIYNRLVRLRALVKEGFSGITVQLRRRADLIPNLVATVQGYA